MSIGKKVDAVIRQREKARAAESKAKEEKDKLSRLEADLQAEMEAQGLTQAAGQYGTAYEARRTLYSLDPEAVEKFYKHVRRYNRFEFLQRRLSQRAIAEYVEDAKRLPPGVKTYEEVKQSVGIIEQLIDQIPGGPMNVGDDGKLNKPDKMAVDGSIEGLIQHFEIVMTNRGWEAPIAEVYAANETANGELGFYIVSDGGPRPWRAAR